MLDVYLLLVIGPKPQIPFRHSCCLAAAIGIFHNEPSTLALFCSRYASWESLVTGFPMYTWDMHPALLQRSLDATSTECQIFRWYLLSTWIVSCRHKKAQKEFQILTAIQYPNQSFEFIASSCWLQLTVYLPGQNWPQVILGVPQRGAHRVRSTRRWSHEDHQSRGSWELYSLCDATSLFA